MTTNKAIAELEQQVSARDVSRLHEICGEPPEFKGPDARRPPPGPPEPAQGEIRVQASDS